MDSMSPLPMHTHMSRKIAKMRCKKVFIAFFNEWVLFIYLPTYTYLPTYYLA